MQPSRLRRRTLNRPKRRDKLNRGCASNDDCLIRLLAAVRRDVGSMGIDIQLASRLLCFGDNLSSAEGDKFESRGLENTRAWPRPLNTVQQHGARATKAAFFSLSPHVHFLLVSRARGHHLLVSC